jgi:catechol 2,3-dioxygenase-like lactoylglutathione lyase family enzyme
MLGDHPIYPVFLSTDLAAAREFYHGRLGLEIISESPSSIDFRSGPTRFNVNLSATGTADTQTKAGWEVEDLRAELDELRGRGGAIQDYDLPGLRTVDGIFDAGFALIAWIVDPGGNALGILQRKR